jgi:hypothetical protein
MSERKDADRKWLYMVAERPVALSSESLRQLEEELDSWGNEGWELVSVVAVGGKLLHYLKAPAPRSTD